MKLLIFLAVFAAFAATSVALKNENCGYRYSPDAVYVLTPVWRYDPYFKACIKINDDGCTENRFASKTMCEDGWLK